MGYSLFAPTIASIPGLQAALDAKAAKAGESFTGACTFAGSLACVAQLSVAGGTKVVNAPILDLYETWNASGTTFIGIQLNVTATASGVASKLLALNVGGTEKFSVSKGGVVACHSAQFYSNVLVFGGVPLTSSTPMFVGDQTWNNAAVTFTALSLAITDTASAAASKLIDLLVGGASKFSVSKAGCIESSSAVNHGSSALILGDGSSVPKIAAYQNSGGVVALSSTGSFAFSSTSNAYSGASDAALHRVAAGVLSVTNGTAANYRDLRVRNILDTNGAIVLGTRGAAVADATDAASAITQLNTLLARLRATGGHGLIAD